MASIDSNTKIKRGGRTAQPLMPQRLLWLVFAKLGRDNPHCKEIEPLSIYASIGT